MSKPIVVKALRFYLSHSYGARAICRNSESVPQYDVSMSISSGDAQLDYLTVLLARFPLLMKRVTCNLPPPHLTFLANVTTAVFIAFTMRKSRFDSQIIPINLQIFFCWF